MEYGDFLPAAGSPVAGPCQAAGCIAGLDGRADQECERRVQGKDEENESYSAHGMAGAAFVSPSSRLAGNSEYSVDPQEIEVKKIEQKRRAASELFFAAATHDLEMRKFENWDSNFT